MEMVLLRIKVWLKETQETFRFAMNLDMRAMEDPVWLLGGKPRQKTIKMVNEAKRRAGISHHN